jgi:hypothetical protein
MRATDVMTREVLTVDPNTAAKAVAPLLSEAGAIFVRVEATPTAAGRRTFEIWIVATDDPADAVAAVRAMVPGHHEVEAIYDRPSEETIKRLALPPGKAWLL